MHRAGKYWEQQAEAFLLKQGLSLVARNFLTQLGEIDLIMRDESRLVFVEVRYRRRSRFTSAAGSVTQQKQKRFRAGKPPVRGTHQAACRACSKSPARPNMPLFYPKGKQHRKGQV